MFVSKYPDWVAQVVLRDGSRLYFDGVKDLMKFHLNPFLYQSTKSRPETAAVFVTDYYSLEISKGPGPSMSSAATFSAPWAGS